MAPQTPRAAEGVDSYESYAGPTVGFAEQVYLYDLLADDKGHTLSVLVNNAQDRAVAVRFNRNDLPCFTVWKNTGAVEDGYVTGLEPATSYPNFKGFERKQGASGCCRREAVGRAVGAWKSAIRPRLYPRYWRRLPCCRATPRRLSIAHHMRDSRPLDEREERHKCAGGDKMKKAGPLPPRKRYPLNHAL